MTYSRVRLAVLLVAALALLAEPAGARTPPVARGLKADMGPLTVALPASGAPGAKGPAPPGSTATKRPTPGPTPSGSAQGGSPKPSASASNSRFGPGGSAKRTGSSAVALTFDDGPDPVQTPLLLDLLAQHKIKATFCLVGFRARDHADLVRRIAADGHTLCNHSWQHLFDLATRPPEEIIRDLTATNDAIRAAVPGAKIKYFRAPGGHFTTPLVDLARAQGMASIYWDVDPRDWDHDGAPDPDHIARVITFVQERTRPGAIVLSHDNRQPTTIEAYRTLLPWLKARFQLAALPT